MGRGVEEYTSRRSVEGVWSTVWLVCTSIGRQRSVMLDHDL